ncbi:MAG: glycine cleavage system protein GcvH [Phycisphaerae bacterium]|nr:glycine cleavage system protein GcvH [Phycisphaerae bacterium]
MAVPNDRKYSQTHEWFQTEGDTVTVGLTQFAADELTDITFVDLPEVGDQVEGGSHFGEVESVKATSELYCPVSGEVIEVNQRLEDEPELVNSDPFGEGWMIKIKCTDLGPLEKMLDGPAYDKMISET